MRAHGSFLDGTEVNAPGRPLVPGAAAPPLEFRHGFAQNRRDVKNVGDAVTVQD
jgi:hypothetical protein